MSPMEEAFYRRRIDFQVDSAASWVELFAEAADLSDLRAAEIAGDGFRMAIAAIGDTLARAEGGA